jgi:hypothetical protein
MQADFFKYPMVWMTPTGHKALQVHGIAVRKMFLKATPTSEVRVVDDVVKVRELLHDWQERIIRPEYVFMGPVEEGDVQMWDNWVRNHSFAWAICKCHTDYSDRASFTPQLTTRIITGLEVSCI